jgi:hypothetical protein
MARNAGVVKSSAQLEIGDAKEAIKTLVEAILKEIFADSDSVKVAADRFFFPHGVELIDVGATVGPKTTPIFEFSLKIAGPTSVRPTSDTGAPPS